MIVWATPGQAQTWQDQTISLQDYIIGQDDRKPVDDKAFPWGSIGKIVSKTRVDAGECTGALVGQRLVLTAAHCLFSDKGFVARRVYFLPHTNVLEKSPKAILAQDHYIPEEFDIRFSEISRKQPKLDWAILILEESVGDQYKFFDVASILDLQELPQGGFTLAGFSADSGLTLTAHQNCSIEKLGHKGSIFYHQCDGMPGDSGAPIWMMSNGKPTIYGVFGSVLFEGDQTRQRAIRGLAASNDFVKKVMELRAQYGDQ